MIHLLCLFKTATNSTVNTETDLAHVGKLLKSRTLEVHVCPRPACIHGHQGSIMACVSTKSRPGALRQHLSPRQDPRDVDWQTDG